jgi:hypothetical protein
MAAFDENEGIDALAEFGLNDEEIAGIQPLAGSTTNAPAKNAKIGELVNAWRTEVGCPEILPYKEELVNTFRRTLQKQERELDKKLDELDEGGDDRLQEMAEHDIYMMDMERVKYSLARYLRARILKIEKMSHYILNSEEHQDRLSDNEKEFLYEINRINNTYIEDQIDKKVRGDKGSGKKYLKTIQDDLIANAEPDLDTFVFALPDDDIDIIDSLDKPATLNAASAVVIDYNSIKEKVYNGEVFLL